MNNSRRRTGGYRLLLVTIAVALSVSACGAGGEGGALHAGEQFFANGQYRAAYIKAKKALQRNSSNGAAWLLLGKASLMLGDPSDALHELQNAKSNGVPDGRWEIPMARTLLVLRQYQTLVKTIKPSDSMSAGQKVEVLVLRGDALLGLGTTTPARYAFETAHKLAPKSALPLVGLAKVAAARHDLDTARQYVSKALSLAPDNARAWMVKGDLAFGDGDYAGAETDYSKAVTLKNHQILPQERYYALGKLAETQIRQNKLKPALAHVEALEKMAPGQPYGHYLHAAIEFKRGKWDDAVSQLQQVLKVAPNNAPAQLLMGAVKFAQNDLAQAEMYLSNVLGVDQKNSAARNLLAVTLYREGESQQALNVLRPLLGKGTSDARALALLQQEAAAGPRAFDEHTQSAAAAGTSAEAELGHAGALAARGNLGAAIQILKQMPEGTASQEYARSRMLTMAYLQNGQKKEAEQTASAYAKDHQKQSAAHLLYGAVLVAAGTYDEARSQFLEAYRLDKKNPAALMSLGALDARQGRYSDAQQRYEAVLKVRPKDALALTAIGELAERQGHREQAIRAFKRAIQAAPKTGAPYVALAVTYSREREFDKALAVTKAFLKQAPKNPAALNAVGAAELNAGHHEAALEPLKAAVAAAPKNPLYRLNLARGEILNHDFAPAEKDLAQVLSATPKDATAIAMLAFLKAQKGDWKGAISVARQLEQYKETHLAGQTLVGDLYMKKGSYRAAARTYGGALKTHYIRPLVIKLFEARNAAGVANAGSVLESWIAKHPGDENVRMLLGLYYQGHQQYDEADAQYLHVLSKYPHNVSALNNLAWVYTLQKNAKAVDYAERAYKLAPDSYAVQDTYGWALVQAGEAKKAVPILTSAAKHASGDSEVHYHLAVAQAQSGDKQGAEETLRALLQDGTDFPEKADAESLYRKLTGAAPTH